MTENQKTVLHFITKFTEKKGYSPTIREIAETLDLSVSTVHGYLERLKLKGVIQWEKGSPRTIRVSERH